MGLFDFLGGGDKIRDAQGVAINKEDYKIKDADKLFGQTQEQYGESAARTRELRGRSDTLMNQLTGQAAGTAPSISEQKLKQDQERNLSMQLAGMQANRGGNTAALQRELLRTQSAGAANIAQQAMQGRLQEQASAQQQLGSIIGQEQAQVANLTQQYLQQGFGIRDAEQKALAEFNRLNVQQALGLADINAQQDRARATSSLEGGKLFGNMVGGLGGFGATGGFSALFGGTPTAAQNQFAAQNSIASKSTAPGRGGM